MRLLDEAEEDLHNFSPSTQARHKRAAKLLRWTFHNHKRERFILCAASQSFLHLVHLHAVHQAQQVLNEVNEANVGDSASIASALEDLKDLAAAVEKHFPASSKDNTKSCSPDVKVLAPSIESSNTSIQNLKPGMVYHSSIMPRLAEAEPSRPFSSTDWSRMLKQVAIHDSESKDRNNASDVNDTLPEKRKRHFQEQTESPRANTCDIGSDSTGHRMRAGRPKRPRIEGPELISTGSIEPESRRLGDDARTVQLSPEAEITSILRQVRGLVTLSSFGKQQLVEQVIEALEIPDNGADHAYIYEPSVSGSSTQPTERAITPVSRQRTTVPLGGHPRADIPFGDPYVPPSLFSRLRSPSDDSSSSRSIFHNPPSSNLTGPLAVDEPLVPLHQAWAAWTSEPLISFSAPLIRILGPAPNSMGAEFSQIDGRNQESVQPSFPGEQSSGYCKPIQQARLVPGGPQLQLATQWTVPDTAQSIVFALNGNIDGLKDLFSRGLASPRDVSESRGFSLMRWALYGGMHHYKTVQFLISQGAHVDEESYEHVFDFGFRSKCSNKELEELSCVRYSRDDNWIEEQNFSLLHQIVFGLSSCSLAAALREYPDAVHAKDTQGRTALDWATARAQLSDMKLLIEHKSNVNGMDVSGRSTILHAVDSHNVEAVCILLKAGADPNPMVPEGLFRSSPLKAASFGGLVEMVKLLLQFGAEVDAYNPEGHTALHAAVITQNVECASILLEKGASLGDVAGNGCTPFVTAIIHNSYAVLKLFVNRRYGHVTAAHVKGPQVLAVIAEHADTDTMSIIASFLPLKLALGLSRVNIAADIKIPRQRRDYDQKLGETFDDLLSSIAMAKEQSAAFRTADGGIGSGLLNYFSPGSLRCEELGD